MESRPPLDRLGGGLARPQLEERFAHGLLLGWRETGLKKMPALVPGLGELADELLVLIHLVQGQAQEGQADGGEDVVLVPVCLVSPFVVVAAVVEFDGEHGHPVVIPADEEIDVLLADPIAVANGAGDRGDDVGQIDLGEELAAPLGELMEKVEESGLVFGEQGFGGIDVLETHLSAGWWSDEFHAMDFIMVIITMDASACRTGR